jgi:hypothetical protein
MKYPGVVFTIAAILGRSALAAADQPPLTPEQQEIVAISTARTEAFNRRDFATFSRYSAADLIGTDGDGSAYERPASPEIQPPDFSLPPEREQRRDCRDFHVRVHGDTAVLNYATTEVGIVGESKITTQLRISECYQKRDGTWVAIACGETQIQVNLRPTVKMDPKRLQEFVGEYVWGSEIVDTVTVEDGHLMSQVTGHKKSEVLFADENTQIERDDFGWVTMVRDSTGRITGYIYHRTDGQEIHSRKIR